MGSSFLRRLVLIKQSAYGSSDTDLGSAIAGVIPTGFKGDWHDQREWADPGDDEYNGLLIPVGRPVQIGDMAEVPFDGDLTFENANWLFNMGWAKAVTATSSVSGWSRNWTAPAEGAINTPLIVTTLVGDNTVQALYGYAMSDGFIDSWEVGAARGDYTKASGTILGHDLRKLSSTNYGHVTITRLQGVDRNIPAWAWKHSIDGNGSTPGTTQLTGTVIDWSLKVSSKFHHKDFQDGDIGPTAYGQGRPEITLDYTFEQNAAALAEFDKFQSNTIRVINIQTKALFTPSLISFDLWGYWTAFDKPGDSDGNTTLAATFKVKGIDGDPVNSYFNIHTITNASSL